MAKRTLAVKTKNPTTKARELPKVVTGIIERKWLGRMLRGSEEIYRKLIESIHDGIWVIDRDSYTTFVNPRMAEMLGYTVEEMLGKPLFSFMDKRGVELATHYVERRRKGIKERHEFEFLRKDGARVYATLETSPLTDEKGGYAGAIASVQDITERKQSEEALKNSERELTIRNKILNILLTVPDDEMYGEVSQVVLEAMESQYGIFGYIDEHGVLIIPSMTKNVWEKCQVPDKTTVFPRETWGGIWGRALIEKKSLYANEGLRVPEGHIPMARVLVVPILYRRNTIGLLEVANRAADYGENDREFLEIIANHIAPILAVRLQRDKQERERKRAEKALEEVKTGLEIKIDERTEELKTSNKRLRSMARQLSLAQARERHYIAIWLHDSVNQNLASCAMKLQTLIQQTSSTKFDGSLQEIHNTLQETIKEMRSLTFQLSPPILYEVGLDAALEELTKTFQRDYDLKCVFNTDGEPKFMDKDVSILLYGLVLELLRNVVKHAKAKRAVVESSRIGDKVQISVSDDGVGLDSEIVSGKKRSKGFGLFAIREVMKDLGGSLDAESTAAGATIVLTAPMEQQQATEV